jgi:DNA-binding MarR family transcriptional regulator
MAAVRRTEKPDGVAFLLAQVGRHAAELFADRISSVGLTSAQAGIVRAIAVYPGQSQQALSARFQTLPSRMVALLDELEDRGYVERRRNPADRRLHALHLTPLGEKLMVTLSQLARQHELELTKNLTEHQRAVLAEALNVIAGDENLTAGVHPGYRTMDTPAASGRQDTQPRV